jgi:hypothetical protein
MDSPNLFHLWASRQPKLSICCSDKWFYNGDIDISVEKEVIQ